MTDKCDRCDGCGQIACGENGKAWSYWEALPAQSQVAIRIGLVFPITCPACLGTGNKVSQRFIQVSRSDADGFYTVDQEGLLRTIGSEFDDIEYDKPGTVVFLRVIEMDQEEFDNLPEFEGW